MTDDVPHLISHEHPMPDHGSGPLGDADWDARYAESDRIWSGNPNGALVTEATDLTPGRALLGTNWRVEVDEVRPRHVTSGAGAHHVGDVVLRARRVS